MALALLLLLLPWHSNSGAPCGAAPVLCPQVATSGKRENVSGPMASRVSQVEMAPLGCWFDWVWK